MLVNEHYSFVLMLKVLGSCWLRIEDREADWSLLHRELSQLPFSVHLLYFNVVNMTSILISISILYTLSRCMNLWIMINRILTLDGKFPNWMLIDGHLIIIIRSNDLSVTRYRKVLTLNVYFQMQFLCFLVIQVLLE